MNKLVLFVIFVLVTGVLITITNDVFALSDKGMEKGKAKGCEKSNDNGKVREKNPHCETGGSIPTNTCDTNLDGSITSDELTILGYGSGFIHAIEQTVANNGGVTNNNDQIDTLDEWNQFQIEQPGVCL